MFKKKDKKAKGAEAPEAEAADKPAAEGGEAGEGAEGDAPKKKGLPLKLIIIAVAALLVLGGGGGGAAYFFLIKPKQQLAAAEHGGKAEAHGKEKDKKKKKDKKKEGEHGGKEGEKGAGAIKEGPDGVWFYTLPSMQVNMQANDGRPSFMKLDVVLEISEEEIGSEIDEQMPRVQDVLQTFLRELRPEDLSGSQGTFRLQQEIKRRLNLMIAPAKVNSVLIQNLLIT